MRKLMIAHTYCLEQEVDANGRSEQFLLTSNGGSVRLHTNLSDVVSVTCYGMRCYDEHDIKINLKLR